MNSLDNPASAEWVDGPPMNEGRVSHKCGRIRKSNESDEYSIIVVGGTADRTSVEIYDIKNKTWSEGPRLPSEIQFL